MLGLVVVPLPGDPTASSSAPSPFMSPAARASPVKADACFQGLGGAKIKVDRARPGESGSGAPEDGDHAGELRGANGLAVRSHGQVGVAVPVEVAAGHRVAELVTGLGAAGDPGEAGSTRSRPSTCPSRPRGRG